MKVLISAYTCEPFRGTESGAGWNWAYELARAGHQVWVLTTTEGMANINAFLLATPTPRLNIVYVGWPNVSRFWGMFRGLLVSLLWQRRALEMARRLDAEVDFDVVHHVTYASLHRGSRLWRLRKPFIFGPVGGGQVTPSGFQRYLRGGRIPELLRTIFVRYFTALLFEAKSTVRHADIVFIANVETRDWAKKLGAQRIEHVHDVGVPSSLIVDPQSRSRIDDDRLKILWVGRLMPSKAILLALEAMAQIAPDVSFSATILGDGVQGRYLNEWIAKLGLADRVVWRGHVAWEEVLDAYATHDVLLFTSLRDTTGSQLIEAMARGAAVVTLDHQGAHLTVPDSAGIKVPVTEARETVAAVARALERLGRDPAMVASMGRGGIAFASQLTWDRKAALASRFYREIVHSDRMPERNSAIAAPS